VQFFIGRESLFLSDADSANQETLTGQAEAAFSNSLALNPKYARAAVGLGSVYFARAKRLVNPAQGDEPPPQALDDAQETVNKALDAYNQAAAQEASSAEGSQTILLAARLGMGTSLRLLGEILERSGQPDEARQRLEDSAKTLNDLLTPLDQANQQRYLAQAYQTLGTAYQYLGYLDSKQNLFAESQAAYEQAIQSYKSCVDLGESSADQIIRKDIVEKFCIPLRDQVEQLIGANAGG